MKTLQKNALWNAFGNIVYVGLQWAVTVFVVRTGGYTDAGYLSLAMSVTGTFQNIAHFGIRNYQVSDTNNKFTNSEYISVRLITCCLAFVFCTIFIYFSSYQKDLNISILCFMLFRLAENFADVLHGIAQKNGRLDIVGKSFLIRGITSVGTFCYIYYESKNLWFGLLGMAIISGVVTILFDWNVVKKLTILDTNKVKGNRRLLIKECFPLFINLLLFAAITVVPRIFLEKIQGAEALGIYASIFAPAMLVQAGIGYLYMPLITIFSEYVHNKDWEAYSKLVIDLLKIVGVSSVLVLLLGKFFGAYFLRLLIGQSVLGYEYLLQGILFCVLLTAIASFLCALLTILRKFKVLLLGTTFSFTCCVLITPILTVKFGLNGTSISLIISLIVLIVLVFRSIKRNEIK